jgi:hypothetical protein
MDQPQYSVGTKIEWTDKDGKEVRAYIVEILSDKVVVKIHGKKGRFTIPKKDVLDSITTAIMEAGKKS